MGSPTLAAKCGRIACIAQCLPVARAHLRKMFPEVDDESILAAVSLEDVQLTLQEFAREGIELNTSGRLASGSEPRLNLMRDFQPVRGVMGELMGTLFVQERNHVLTALEQVAARAGGNAVGRQAVRSQVRLRSCCGGSSWWIEAIPARNTLRLRDAEFVTGVRWRLGLPVCRPGKCQLCPVKYGDMPSLAEDACGICLDLQGDHIVSCKKGGGAQRVHGAVGRVLGSAARDAGAECNFEVTVPELLKGTAGAEDAVEAILDVHIWSVRPCPLEVWVDVTCRHPHAARYRSRAAALDGEAARVGEEDKAKRYGPGVAGVVVTTAAIESWGRMAPGFEMLLGRLEALWAARHFAGPAETAAVARRWRQEIGIAQVKCLSRSIDMAQRGSVSGVVSAPAGEIQASQ